MKGFLVFLICIFCFAIAGFSADRYLITPLIDTAVILKKIQADYSIINNRLRFYKRNLKTLHQCR